MTETSHASLSTMRLADLQKLAASMGLKGTSRLRKSELVAAIRDGGAAPAPRTPAVAARPPAPRTPAVAARPPAPRTPQPSPRPRPRVTPRPLSAVSGPRRRSSPQRRPSPARVVGA